MFPIVSIRIIYRAITRWSENGGMRTGAALAYYALFSVAPLMLIVVHATGAVFGEDAAKGRVRDQIDSVMGKEVAKEVTGEFEEFATKFATKAARPSNTFWTPTMSALFLLIGALGAFLHIRSALCSIWKLEPPRGNNWLGFLWDYALSLIMVFATATMIFISLAFGLIVPVLQRTIEQNRIDHAYWHWFEVGGSFAFLTLFFAASYRVLSGGRISWGYVIYGSVIAAVMFTVGKTLLSHYIVYTGTVSMYGAAGSVVVFLMWVYYSSQILFFGAELIQARRTRHEWLHGEATPEP